MKADIAVLSTIVATAIGAAVPFSPVPNVLENRQSSGCFPFEDPHCCINYAVCQCANGWFYQFNQNTKDCDPPWGIYGTDVHDLPGFCC